MTWSLGEIEVLARKATKGAGYDWGIAEEAGKAVRWLCAAGLPGTDVLAELLTLNDGRAYKDCCPDCAGAHWQARDGVLCPLITGTAICDRAGMLAQGDRITLGKVAFPLLLVPYIASASDGAGRAINIEWPGLTMCRADRSTTIDATSEAMAMGSCDTVTLQHAKTMTGTRVRRAYRGDISEQTRQVLADFAHRTYAPDTPESRLSGAGAGLSDND